MVLENVGNAIVDEVTNSSTSAVFNVVSELGKIGNWLQAIGIIVVIWIIIQVVNFIFNHKKKNYLKSIEQRLKQVEKKIDKLSKSGKKIARKR
ncbi:MAG: hypothetical protein ABH811_00690 [archaeon]